jgi:betaine reductase
MVKEIERYGIPIVHMATITTISESMLEPKKQDSYHPLLEPTSSLLHPHPVGNPGLNSEDEHALRKELVKRALNGLATDITKITHFE